MVSNAGRGDRQTKETIGSIPSEVLVQRLRSKEAVPLTTNTARCNDRFQEFLKLVMPDLESSETRSADPDKEEKVRHAAEMAIKEIRLYGFELKKAEAIEQTSERDIDEYRKQRDQIEENIKEVQTEIGTLKEGLVVERKKRYNKEIYEETCKDINTYPPHKATKLEIEKLEKERFAADEKKKAVQAVQRLKQKQIALIMQSLADVQATVEEGDADDGPTAGALELVHPEEDGDMGEGDEDGDGDDRDDDANGPEDDGEEDVGRRRGGRRERTGSEDGNDSEGEEGRRAAGLENGEVTLGAGAAGEGARAGAPEDEEMPDVA